MFRQAKLRAMARLPLLLLIISKMLVGGSNDDRLAHPVAAARRPCGRFCAFYGFCDMAPWTFETPQPPRQPPTLQDHAVVTAFTTSGPVEMADAKASLLQAAGCGGDAQSQCEEALLQQMNAKARSPPARPPAVAALR